MKRIFLFATISSALLLQGCKAPGLSRPLSVLSSQAANEQAAKMGWPAMMASTGVKAINITVMAGGSNAAIRAESEVGGGVKTRSVSLSKPSPQFLNLRFACDTPLACKMGRVVASGQIGGPSFDAELALGQLDSAVASLLLQANTGRTDE